MKKFILAFLVVMLAAGAAYALDYEVSGSYYVRGHHNDNLALATSDAPSFQHYDHEFDLRVNFVIDETTSIKTRWEIVDEEPWDGAVRSDANTAGTADSYGNNIEAEWVYLEHKFPTGTVLSVGQMTGGGWGTEFQDNIGPAKRIKVVQLFPWGLIVGLIQKNDEQGQANAAVKDSENDDVDIYAIGAVINVGPVSLMPLWEPIYWGNMAVGGQDQDGGDLTANYYTLDFTGNFGMIGFEGAISSLDLDYDPGFGTDVTLDAFYAKVWANFEAFKVGGLYYWLEWDSDVGVGTPAGAEWAPTLIMAEEVEGGAGSDAMAAAILGGETAWAAYQLFADFAFGKFSVGGSITYFSSNDDSSGTKWQDSEAMEYNLTAAYKITDNLVYDVGLGYMSVDYEQQFSNDPEDVTYAFHRLKVTF
jgi:hypothetical protein